MFNRIISLILAAAVFGCPLWCSMGICQCSGGAIAAKNSEETGQCCQPPCCTAGQKPQELRWPSNGDPQPEPEGLRCQGICGGAVLESPCQIPTAGLCQFLPALKIVQHWLQATQQCEVRGLSFPDDNRSENWGRSVRILYMSFQC